MQPPPPSPSFMPTKTFQRGQKIHSTSHQEKTEWILLVISADGNDWKRELEGQSLSDGKKVKVHITSWAMIHVEAGSEKGRNIVCRFPVDGEEINISPDFVLFRAFPNDLFGKNFRRQVLGLAFSGIGGVNSVDSVLRTMDRPIVHAEMLRISERLGNDKFPVVPAKYHPNGPSGNKHRLVPMEFPTVVKVGSSYGGYGKTIAHTKGEYDDIVSLLALGTEYFTEEPLVTHEYEFRVQVIGPYVRCFRRNSHNNWKNQCGNVVFTDHPWDPKYSLWVDEVRQLFGGLDLFGIDVLHTVEDQDFILEINDCAMGFDHDYEAEDKKWVREVVLQRMNERLCGGKKNCYLGVYELSKYSRMELKGKEFLV